ncbi:anaphase-promoting complex subunit 1 [Daphnia magna]|uniref:anaphase-promoting complex subunit 1 n=1 Tax=Daphnia magna TaxID=35525 RepID=UPI001E1BA5F5|nr:anaphase-promoting complex subunit 1 [Daphnia magna]XP_045026364.1 anaphase-promoting complex subunit 1 [Daphnia magna]XP_045026365.1 anaphase-promoting complex subunit 1 [Daphnia magna]
MIAAGEPQVYVPHGKQILEQYESSSYRRTSAFNTSLESQDVFTLSTLGKDSEEETEVYIHENTVVWSRGYGEVYWELVKKYTCDGSVQQAFWFDFDENPNRPSCANVMSTDKPIGRKIPSLCIVEKSKVTVHTMNGDEYICAVPYEIHRVWPTRFGLVFEKCQTSNPDIPNWFSLYHPLEEIVPVVLRDGIDREHVNFAKDKKLKFVYTGIDPSICVTFNEDTGLHSIWLIRKAEVDESLCVSVSNKGISNPSANQSAFSGTFVPSNVASPSLSRSFALSQIYNTSFQQSPANLPSIFNTTARTPKFDLDLSHRFNTPKGSKNYAQHFAMSSLQFNQSKISGSPLRRIGSNSRTSAILARTPVPSPSASSLFNEMEVADDEEPLLPDLCLQILWSEDSKKSSCSQAVKAFVAVDWLGKSCVCWLMDDEKTLRCIDLKVTENRNTGNPLYICCAQWTIPAKDAEYIPALKAVLVLDPVLSDGNSLTLYSGSTKLTKVHVPNCSPPSGTGISLSIQRLSLEASSINSKFIPSTPLNSSRRSSLMPDLTSSIVHDSSVTLSPIPASSPPLSFRTLQDAVGRQVTLKCSDRSLLRTLLPPLCTSALVERCLRSLRAALPPDIYLAVAAKFYCVRNAPGPADFSPPAEFDAFRSTLLTLLGFDAKSLDASISSIASPVVESKKSRTNLEEGANEDWQYLVESQYAKIFPQLFGLDFFRGLNPIAQQTVVQVNSDSAYFAYLPHVLLVLHVLFEDLKLDALMWSDAQLLVTLLIPLASALNLTQYCDSYWRDFPAVWNSNNIKLGVVHPSDLDKLQGMIQRMEVPCNIHIHLLSLMSKKKICTPYPHVKLVNTRSRDIITLFAILYGTADEHHLVSVHEYVRDFEWVEHSGRVSLPFNVVVPSQQRRQTALVLKMSSCGWTREDLNALPAGIGLPLRYALFCCQLDPPTDWPDEAYKLINRQDMCQLPAGCAIQPLSSIAPELNLKIEAQRNKSAGSGGISKDDYAEDGMEGVIDLPIWKLLFPRDHRIQEVRRLLGSSRPVVVVLPASQQQGLSEHELIEEREKQLLVLCIRIMAISVGRGMLTLHTATPTVTETLSIPKLCLTGKTPHNGAAVDMTHIDVPANMSLWPQFHNGVAAGLRVSPGTKYVDSNWINLSRGGNRPGQTAATPALGELNAEVAGFLLGLGITGHLNKFNDLVIHEHLNRDHEMTQLALVLGLGIGKRGSMEADTLRIISVYVESLSPASSSSINGCGGGSIEVPQNVRVAALMSIGFLYQGSAHRYMTEVLLDEIDRPPGPEMDNCVDRESYSLSAGLALGLVTLGQGGQMTGLADLRLADTLYHFMVGGTKRNCNSSNAKPRSTMSSASYQIREGNTVNVDVTAPGAILALGLMFHRTNNTAAAKWMEAPDSQQLLDSIRPDFLLLRTLARGLILWDDVMPTRDWVESNVPPNIRRYSLRNPGDPDSQSQQVDYETMNQAFYNIMAGSCFVLGLKFAGSSNAEAFNTLYRYSKVLISLSGRSVAEWAGKATLEACLNTLVLSLSMVMAGTGDLQVLRLCRHLRMRSGTFSNVVTYGSHMATHMALGFLYLGGGRLSLSTSPEAIAALVCACYPKFPTHSNDNRYHLQALRHLYVLATEPRLLMPIEIPNMQPCYTTLQVVFNNADSSSFQLRAPCLLPELRFLQRVQLLDPRYRTIVFDRQHNWNKLKCILQGKDHLIVQRKAGCLSYAEDPTGLASLATPTLSAWAIRASTVANFTTDKFVIFLCRHFLGAPEKGQTQILIKQECKPLDTQLRLLSLVLNDCVVNEKTEMVKPWLQLLHKSGQRDSSTLPLWQLKFLINFPVNSSPSSKSTPFIDPEMVLALRHELESTWDHIDAELRTSLHNYFAGKDTPRERSQSVDLANLTVFYDLPLPLPKFAADPVSLLIQSGDQKLAARLAILLHL